jgi:UDP-N-acetylmuramate--alanine ligase
MPVATRGEALAALLKGPRTVVVAGTHGKTTTTSMIVSVLRSAGADPTYLVGGELNDVGTNGRAGGDDLVVAESDESDGSFLLLRPTVGVITNVEADHLDYWKSLQRVRRAFAAFVANVKEGGSVVVPAGEQELAAERPPRSELLTFGDRGDVRCKDVELPIEGARFTLEAPEGEAQVALRVPGRHNVLNALAAAGACLAIGLPLAAIAAGLASFLGVKRRFQIRGTAGGVTIIDDYAHNPSKVRASLATARTGPWERVIAVFQPHRYTRTSILRSQFGESFGDADRIVVTDVYGAGEQPVPGVTGKLVADAVCRRFPGRTVAYLPHRAELLRYLAAAARPGDALLTLGAGDISSIGDDLLLRLERR